MIKGTALPRTIYLIFFGLLVISAAYFLFTKSQPYIYARAMNCTMENIDDVHLYTDEDSLYQKSPSEFIEFVAPIAMKSCKADIDAFIMSAVQKAGYEKGDVSEKQYAEIHKAVEERFIEELKTLYYED